MDEATLRRVWDRTILTTHSDPGTTYKPPRTTAVEPLQAGFALGDELARAGMGVVFRARQSSLGRDVAVKKIRPDLAGDEALFIAEARVTGMLDHPNIVPVHELARTPEGELFLAMKLVRWAEAGSWDCVYAYPPEDLAAPPQGPLRRTGVRADRPGRPPSGAARRSRSPCRSAVSFETP